VTEKCGAGVMVFNDTFHRREWSLNGVALVSFWVGATGRSPDFAGINLIRQR
jgi:hypothetical protein